MRSATSYSVPACSTEFSQSSLASSTTVSATSSRPASVSAATSMRRASPGDRASGASRIRRSSGTGTPPVCTVARGVHPVVGRAVAHPAADTGASAHGLLCGFGVACSEVQGMTTTHNGVPPVPAVDESTDDRPRTPGSPRRCAPCASAASTRALPRGLRREVVEEFDALVGLLERRNRDLLRIGRVVGREGRMLERLNEEAYDGAWAEGVHAVNALIDDLGQSAAETARVIEAVAQGDLSQHMALEIAGRPLRGEFLRIGRTVNTMVDQLSSFADEVTRVAREVGIDGRLGGQAAVRGVSGTWRDLTDSVNTMASNLTDQVRSISSAATAIAQGDLSRKITVSARGEVAELAETINALTDTLRRFADEVTRVAREVGTDGRLGGQAAVPNVAGHLEGPHRRGQPDGREPHRAGARHRPGRDGRRDRRPEPEDHRRRARARSWS